MISTSLVITFNQLLKILRQKIKNFPIFEGLENKPPGGSLEVLPYLFPLFNNSHNLELGYFIQFYEKWNSPAGININYDNTVSAGRPDRHVVQ